MVYPHKWSPISYRSSAGQGKFAGQRPTLSGGEGMMISLLFHSLSMHWWRWLGDRNGVRLEDVLLQRFREVTNGPLWFRTNLRATGEIRHKCTAAGRRNISYFTTTCSAATSQDTRQREVKCYQVRSCLTNVLRTTYNIHWRTLNVRLDAVCKPIR